ncbi:hypothetical protein Ddye_001159 [Dipteronia dyeriana]|uniref:Reverse transcriptase domain-containing protein n=1 Tax=Dipteronia dyeriana TaxID=168575 RepID=A0AAD9XNQ4_9ROSI|nr:hypothetical protein Ddye_001159 [Dipteronia dyeriana]
MRQSLLVTSPNVVLILKVDNPNTPNDFRPVALCSVVYKTVAKILAARLKSLLPGLISSHQSAFVSGHFIFDNVMVAFKSLHFISQKKVGKKGLMALRLDMNKAYDRVEWNFLRAVMIKMNFYQDWIRLVLERVSSTSLSFVLNSRISSSVKPSRGLR